jgi:hypothetical protein
MKQQHQMLLMLPRRNAVGVAFAIPQKPLACVMLDSPGRRAINWRVKTIAPMLGVVGRYSSSANYGQ